MRHVLRAIPTYHLMALALYRKGPQEMEKMCRWFLWGMNPTGGHRKPLIAWNDVTTPTKDGGLDLYTFEKQAEALKMRHTTKLISEGKKKWVLMAHELILKSAKVGPHKKERRLWTCSGILLL